MTRCAACRRLIRGTHDDIMVCAENLNDEAFRVYCMQCAPKLRPDAFGGVFVQRGIKQSY